MTYPYDTENPVVTALQGCVEALQAVTKAQLDAMGVQRLPGAGEYAFRRLTDPQLVPVGPGASQFPLPDGFFDQGGPGFNATSFCVVNPNKCWVRMRGSTDTFQPVTATTGWMFSPGFFGVFSTQFPKFMSAMAIAFPGEPLPSSFMPLEVSYGGGT